MQAIRKIPLSVAIRKRVDEVVDGTDYRSDDPGTSQTHDTDRLKWVWKWYVPEY